MQPYDIDKDTQQTVDEYGVWWLASYPKSGNTWVRMFLNAAITRFPVELNSAFQYVQSDKPSHFLQSVSSVPIDRLSGRNAAYMRPAGIVNALSMASRDLCLKTHNANITLDGIPLCPAKLSKGALYIVRDPRDVAVSFAKHIGSSIDDTIGLMNCDKGCLINQRGTWVHWLGAWSSHVASWLDERNNIPTSCVRYEALLEQPEDTFRGILAALGLSGMVDEAAMQFALEQTKFTRLQELEAKRGFCERGKKQSEFFNHGQSGRWRDVLTQSQIERIETDHGNMMDELGYELSLVGV